MNLLPVVTSMGLIALLCFIGGMATGALCLSIYAAYTAEEEDDEG